MNLGDGLSMQEKRLIAGNSRASVRVSRQTISKWETGKLVPDTDSPKISQCCKECRWMN